MRSGVEAAGDDDLDALVAGQVEPGADLLDEVGGARGRAPTGVSRRTPHSRSPSASATRSDSSASSLKVSTSTMRGTSGSMWRSNASAARTVSPKMMISACGIVPVGASPARRAPAGVEAPTQPPTTAA